MSLSRSTSTIIGQRLRERREMLGWSLERVGVAIGLDESSARGRISRYELGVHMPPAQTTLQLARVVSVPHAYLHCENARLAEIILAASELPAHDQEHLLNSLKERLAQIKSTERSK